MKDEFLLDPLISAILFLSSQAPCEALCVDWILGQLFQIGTVMIHFVELRLRRIQHIVQRHRASRKQESRLSPRPAIPTRDQFPRGENTQVEISTYPGTKGVYTAQ